MDGAMAYRQPDHSCPFTPCGQEALIFSRIDPNATAPQELEALSVAA